MRKNETIFFTSCATQTDTDLVLCHMYEELFASIFNRQYFSLGYMEAEWLIIRSGNLQTIKSLLDAI